MAVVSHAHLVLHLKWNSNDTRQKAGSGKGRAGPESGRHGFGCFRFNFDDLRHFPPPHSHGVGKQTTRGRNGGQK